MIAVSPVVIAIVGLFLTVLTMFAHLVRTVSRIEFKTDEMWRWFTGGDEGPGMLGRRRYDGLHTETDEEKETSGRRRYDRPAAGAR